MAKHKWIRAAVKHPQSLHRDLHVAPDEKIPLAKLQAATHSDSPTVRKRAALAETLGKMNRGSAHREGGPVTPEDRSARLYGPKHVRKA